MDAAPFGLFCFFAFAAIALVVVIGIFGYLQAEKRRKALAAWAQGRGLRFSPDRDSGIDGRYPHFSCLQSGSNRYAYNICDGPAGNRHLCAFDYHYETHSTDSKGRQETHHHYFSAVILDTEYRLQPLSLRAENFFDKIAEFVGFDDIDFESAQFSREFHVKASNKKWAYDVIQQSTMEFLLESPRFAVQMHGRSLIASRGGTFDMATFESAIGVLEGILDRLPEGLKKELQN
jgi:hypothetical protein